MHPHSRTLRGRASHRRRFQAHNAVQHKAVEVLTRTERDILR
ncbi:hypothetical protein HMPREF0307_02378 [Corynebacterium sp. DNF00584]|nr:hypothetical protein HMPREF0307_02378 [Corynebacterium sp. DNF00584]